VKACISENDLLDIVRGTISLAEAPAIEEHLAECASCSAALAALAAPPEPGDASPPSSGEIAPPSLLGQKLGPYRLDARIGAGGMSDVYRAWDERLARYVAVKVLSPRVAGSPEQVRRLAAEARAAAAITHPNVVHVYDVGSEGGAQFIVTELYEGESLRSRIQRGPLPRAEALGLAVQLARGLAAAHAEGVVHRDLKPENLIVTADGTLKILDFGLAKLTGERARGLDSTRPRSVLGTAGYLSPEQACGEPADARSDLFAAGAVLYEMLTGERAFGGASFSERIAAVLRDDPPRLGDGSLGDMAGVVTRCLEKEPKHRFQSAEDLAWVLTGLSGAPRAASRPPDRSPEKTSTSSPIGRRTFAFATALAGLAGLGAGRFLWPSRPPRGAAKGPSYQQLTFRHGRVTSARFTRDGASVIYGASWDGLPLAIFTTRIGGGGTRPLPLPSAEVLAVSSRGEIAISIGHRYIEGFHAAGQLATVPLENGEPRPVEAGVQEADYTPDGRELAIVRRGPQGFRLELPLGHTLFEAPWISHPRISPDGARVACLVHPSPHDDRGGVAIVDRATGRARTLSEGWTSIVGLGWSPDGAGLWFSAARDGGNNGVVAIDLDGRETFTARTTGRLRLHDVAADGKVAVTHDTWSMPLRVRAPSASAEADFSLSDISVVTDISADGGTIVFAEIGDVESARGSYLRAVLAGQALRLGDGGALALSDDGRRVLSMLYEPAPRLLVYSVSSGEAAPVPLGPIDDVAWARWRGDRIVLGASAAGRRQRLWTTTLSAKEPTPLTPEGVSGRGEVTSDGARVAFVARDGRLLVVSLDHPESMAPVPGAYPDEVVCGFRKGDREVYLRTRTIPVHVRRVDLATGRSEPHFDVTPPPLGLKGVEVLLVSSAGDAYAYSYGQELSRLYAMTVGAAG
jgi:serine/threonine protein kinase